MAEFIEVYGADEHNLQHLRVRIPKYQLVVITGVSGSGKSSLAFDTLYAEGRRRYLSSFSGYIQQFMGVMKRPQVEKIIGLSPVIAIEQKTIGKGARSTVGTITEVLDFLRLLYARIGKAYSYVSGQPMVQFSEEQICEDIQKRFAHKKIKLFSVLVRGRKGHYTELFSQFAARGYLKMRVDGVVRELVEPLVLDRYKIHNIELLVDAFVVDEPNTTRLSAGIVESFRLSKEQLLLVEVEGQTELQVYAKKLFCPQSGISYETPSPYTFSFNSPFGYCPFCRGVGGQNKPDLEKIILAPHVSLADGVLRPFGKHTDPSFAALIPVLESRKIPLHTPWEKLDKKQCDFLLYHKGKTFIGAIPLIERAYEDEHTALGEWAAEYVSVMPCEYCAGTRLRKESLHFLVAGKNIADLCAWTVTELLDWFSRLDEQLSPRHQRICAELCKQVRDRLGFLVDIGLGYLRLQLPAHALSGGEAQRVRLATQIATRLRGITYILDEPSIGLHPTDNARLILALQKLRDLGNSVLVVEHDRDIILAADHIIDIGPGAGKFGGKVVEQGTPQAFVASDRSQTAAYLRRASVPKTYNRRQGNGAEIVLKGASGNNLRQVDLHIPLGKFVAVTGVSGSGKSTLITETLYPVLSTYVQRIKKAALPYVSVHGCEHIDKVIEIDQSPIGRIPRSNAATYCGFFTEIRQLFAAVPQSRARAYKVGQFSFNVKGGRCEHCQGAGLILVEMGFLPPVTVTCEICQGQRYTRETLSVRYKGKNIAEVLSMTVDEAAAFFAPIPSLFKRIEVLQEVGLGYLPLGQSSVLLSGGEAQRVKLSTELARKQTGKTLYILDEPTTGLHFQDIDLLIRLLDKLVSFGNTVIVIEHNIDVIMRADHIIDLGEGGGDAGGRIIAQGTPEQVAQVKNSPIAPFLTCL